MERNSIFYKKQNNEQKRRMSKGQMAKRANDKKGRMANVGEFQTRKYKTINKRTNDNKERMTKKGK